MARLSINLLGAFRVVLDGLPVTRFVSDKARALLAYLAVEVHTAHRRERLQGLLWPDCTNRDASNSLRTALANVRRVIGDHGANPPFLDVSRQTVQFNLSSDSWIDVIAVASLLPTGGYRQQPDPEAISRWEKAVGLYRGQFLEGFSIADSPPFEEWTLLERENLDRQVLEALDRLVDWHEAHGQLERALMYARRQVDLDPLRESAHRQLMRLLVLSGQRATALAQYEACRQVLKKELDDPDQEPDEQTRELYRRIQAGEIQTRCIVGAPRPTYVPSPPPDPAILPDPGPQLSGWRLPLGRNALFTGRHEPLLALARALLYAQTGPSLITLAVTGMGGTGKTQLAVEFAYRYGRYLHGVHWLDGRDPARFDAEVAACGVAMSLPNWPKEQLEQVAYTLATWANDGPRLVILDDLEDLASAREWLPRLAVGPVRLLLTTRRSNWPRDLGLALLPLAAFSPEESRAFLRRTLPTSRSTDADLNALAARLAHLPLALQLAARYLDAHPRLSIAEYTTGLTSVLGDPAMKAWRADLGDPVSHDLDLAATFLRSWQHVADERARRLFLICGHCAPNQPIPCALLERATGLERNACDEELSLLSGLGLLTLNDPAAGPAIHPLLAEFACKLPLTQQKEREGVQGQFEPLQALADALADLSHDAIETGLPACFYPLLPHLEAALAAADSAGLPQAGALWDNLGSHLRDVAALSRARDCHERALAIDERAYGPDHPNVARNINNLGRVLYRLGDLATARAAFERALAIDERTYGPNSPAVAIRANNLGMVLRDLGDLAGARTALDRALAIDERVYGPDHPNVAIRVNNLGSVLRDLGDLVGARTACERALTINERTYGPEHPEVATSVNNLGRALRALGDLAAARAACERAMTIDERVFGPDHPNVARDVNNLGGVLQDLGDLDGARAAFERALRIFETVLPRGHPRIRRVRDDLDSLP